MSRDPLGCPGPHFGNHCYRVTPLCKASCRGGNISCPWTMSWFALLVQLFPVLFISFCVFPLVVHVPLCFLFYFGNCCLVLHPSSCQVSLLFDRLLCSYVFHLCWLSHLCLVTPFVLSLCVSPLFLCNHLFDFLVPVLSSSYSSCSLYYLRVYLYSVWSFLSSARH